jgi:hypothetical protein
MYQADRWQNGGLLVTQAYLVLDAVVATGTTVDFGGLNFAQADRPTMNARIE